jgi:hypothetical protein
VAKPFDFREILEGNKIAESEIAGGDTGLETFTPEEQELAKKTMEAYAVGEEIPLEGEISTELPPEEEFTMEDLEAARAAAAPVEEFTTEDLEAARAAVAPVEEFTTEDLAKAKEAMAPVEEFTTEDLAKAKEAMAAPYAEAYTPGKMSPQTQKEVEASVKERENKPLSKVLGVGSVGTESILMEGINSVKRGAMHVWEAFGGKAPEGAYDRPEEDVSKIIDPATGAVADLRSLMVNPKIGTAAKEKALDEVINSQLGLPPGEAAKGREDAIGSASIGGMVQALDSLVTQGAATGWIKYGVSKFTDNKLPMPPDYFSPEAKAYIANNLNSGKAIGVHGVEVKIPEGSNPEEVMKKMFDNVVATAHDLYAMGTTSAALENAGLPLMFAGNALKGLFAAAELTKGEAAMKAMLVAANPLTAVFERYGVKLLGVGAMSKPAQFLTRVGVSGAEAAAMTPPTTAGGFDPATMAASAAVGAGMHVGVAGVGKVLGSLSKRGAKVIHTPEELVHIETQKQAMAMVKTLPEDRVQAIIRGEEQVAPELRTEIRNVVEAKQLFSDFNPGTVEKILIEGADIPEIRAQLDAIISHTRQMSPEQRAAHLAWKKASRQLKAPELRSEARKLSETVEYSAALGDDALMQKMMASNNLQNMIEPYGQLKRSYLNNSSSMYRSEIQDILQSGLEGYNVDKAAYLKLTPKSALHIENVIRMQTEDLDYNKALEKLKANSYKVDSAGIKVQDTLDKVVAKTQDPRVVGLKAHIDQAIKANSTINLDYAIKELTDLGVETGEHAPGLLATQISNYNRLHNNHIDLKQDMQNAVTHNALLERRKISTKANTSAGHNLLRTAAVYAAPDSIAARFNEQIQHVALDSKVPQEIKDLSAELIGEASQRISTGMPISEGKIQFLRDSIKGIKQANDVRPMLDAMDHWNVEAKALSVLRAQMGALQETPGGVLELLPSFRRAGDVIVSPQNMRRLEYYHQYLSSVWVDALDGKPINEKVKQDLYHMAFGSEEQKIKIVMDPTSPISTDIHSDNMLRSLQVYSRDLLDSLNDLHMIAFGKRLDVEMFLAYLSNPANGDNGNMAVEAMGYNVARYSDKLALWNKVKEEGNSFLLTLASPEFLEGLMTKKSYISCGVGFEGIATAHRESVQEHMNLFSDDVAHLEKQMLKRGWGSEEFGTKVNKLQGAMDKGGTGISKLRQGFFVLRQTGETIDTELGSVAKRIFTNEDLLRRMNDASIKDNRPVGSELMREVINELIPAKEAAKIIARNGHIDMFNYFSATVKNAPKESTVAIWKDVYECLEFLNGMRIKGYNNHVRSVSELNIRHRNTGYVQEPLRFREDYVYTKKMSKGRVIDYVDNIFSAEANLTKRFGSSLQGQLDKADSLGIDLMHPITATIMDTQSMIRDTTAWHAKTTLQEYGVLLHSLGYEKLSSALLNVLETNTLGKLNSRVVQEGLRSAYEGILKVPYVNSIMLTTVAAAKLVGAKAMQTSLSSIRSLSRSFISQPIMNFVYGGKSTTGKFFGKVLQYVFFKSTRNRLASPDGPIAPELHRLVRETLRGYIDVNNRAQMEAVNDALLLSGKTRGGLTVANKVAVVSDRLIDQAFEKMTQIAKENLESAMSLQILETGASVYTKALGILKSEGGDAAISYLGPEVKTLKQTQLYALVSLMGKGLKSGDVYMAADPFLKMYHTNNVGRFGVHASPAFIRDFIQPILPASATFYAAITNNVYRAMSQSVELGAETVAKVRGIFSEKTGLPINTSTRVLTTLLMGGGMAYMARIMKDGVADTWFGSQLDDKQTMEQAPLGRAFLHGTGIDLSTALPFPELLNLINSGMKGDVAGVKDVFFKTFLDIGKQKNTPFASADLLNMYKALSTLNEITGDVFPILNLLPSKITDAKKELSSATEEFQNNLANGMSIDVAQGKVDKATEKIRDLENTYFTHGWVALADLVVQNMPIASIVTAGTHPFAIASMYRNEQSKAAMEGEMHRGMGRDDYAGWFNMLQQSYGITDIHDKGSNAARKWYGAVYGEYGSNEMPANLRMTQEEIDYNIKMALKWDGLMVDTDMWLNYMVKKGNIEKLGGFNVGGSLKDGGLLEVMKDKLHKRTSPIPPPNRPVYPENPVRQLLRETKLPDEKKPR